MPIPTSRTKERGRIIINRDLCNGCGLCVSVCKDFSLTIENGKVKLSDMVMYRLQEHFGLLQKLV